MKYILTILCIFILCSTVVLGIEPVDQIDSFHSDVTVNPDTSILIKETVVHTTNTAKHGIYRYIPLDYQYNQIHKTLRISDISITNQNLQPIPFTQKNESGNLVFKIGEADKTYTGTKTYIITYKLDRLLTHYDTHDELYLDITGEGWQLPIKTSSAIVKSAAANIKDVICYSGDINTYDKLCKVEKNQNFAQFTYTKPISYGANFTVVVGFNTPNQFVFPTKEQVYRQFLLDNWPIIILLLPLPLMFAYWYKFGRDYTFLSPNVFEEDPKAPQKQTPLFDFAPRTPFVYEPLKITPGEAGLIIDEKVDNQDIVAEIIELTRLKYMQIVPLEKSGFFGSSLDYRFVKLDSGKVDLAPHQQYLLNHIFEGREETTLSDLKGKFYTHLDALKGMLNSSLTKKRFFTKDPTTSRYLGVLFVIFIAVILGMVLLATNYLTYAPNSFLLLIPQIPIIILLIYKMPQKTALGHNYMLQAKGLMATIKFGKWREEIKEKHLFIEEVLPFAISLGVVGKLAKDMKDLGLNPPDYFTPSLAHNLALNHFISDFSRQTTANLSYNPSSSRMSGGSGFSGGFSGGGGGGGGGGSW